MRRTPILRVAVSAALLFGATACGDDDDEAVDATTTTQPDGPTAIEVTLTSDGLEGVPSELPAGLVEITLVNDSEAYGSLDITRVTEGTSEDDFVAGLAPLFQGGEFPEYFASNVGVEADAGETQTSTVILREGEHIAWSEVGPPEGEEDTEETETETVTETESGTEGADTSTTVAGDGGDDDTTTSTTAAEDTTTSTTSTTVAGEEEGAAGVGGPTGTLTAVAAENESETESATEEGVDDAAEEDEPLAEEPAGGEGEGEGAGMPEVVTAALMVTAGDATAELPEADGEIVARDYEFEATLDGPGTINFRNEGPQQFHHAVVMDFGTNDPAAVEEAFPAILESEGDPSALPATGDLDMDEVDFEFGGSGVFGPDGAAGTFEADIVEGNTYVLVCFIQDRTGGPPHAIAYDMWDVVQAGGDPDGSTTTEG